MWRKYFVVGLAAPTVAEVRWQGWPQRVSHTSLVRLSQVACKKIIFRKYRTQQAAREERFKIFYEEGRLRNVNNSQQLDKRE
jgi:hypothetical protein